MEQIKNNLKENIFKEKLQNFHNFFKNCLNEFDYIFIRNGENDDEVKKIKTCAFHSCFFRNEFFNTMILISTDNFIFFGKDKNLEIFNQFKNEFSEAGFKLHVIKTEDSNIQEQWKFLNKLINKDSIKKIGTIVREEPKGKLADSFKENFNSIEIDNISIKLQEFLSVKFKKDIEIVKSVSKLNISIFNTSIERLENIIDMNKKIKHSEISEIIESYFENNKNNLTNNYKLSKNDFDLAYPPIIQSGKYYDLKPNAESNDNILSDDIITLSVGFNYYDLHTNIIRTLILCPNDKTKNTYKILYEAHKLLISKLVPGKIIKDIYNEVKEFLIKEDSTLEENIPNNFGYGIGYEFKEIVLLINKSNERKIKENMIFHVTMNIGNILNGKAIMLGDTIIINKNSNENLSHKVEKNYDKISYTFKDDKDNNKKDDSEEIKEKVKKPIEKDAKEIRLTRFQLKQKKFEENEMKYLKIRENQKKLFEQKTSEITKRYEIGNFLLNKNESNQMDLEKLKSYTQNTFPNLGLDNIHFDFDKFCILLPINKRIVPFHIVCIKNASKSNEGSTNYLRINFHFPGSGNNNISYPNFDDPDYKPLYLKEIFFKSRNGAKINEILNQIKSLQKKYKEKDLNDYSENNFKAGQLKTKIKMLEDLKIKPNISGKKTIGNLIAYTNGLKYQSKKDEQIIIASTNIKHAFFQPCDDEMMILIHFHLKKAIIVGKKLTFDIQFYSEIGILNEDLMDRRRYNEIDELQQEEYERQLKKKMNDSFTLFVKLLENNMQGNIKIDIPYKKLGFDGSVSNNSGFIAPTVNCLVNFDSPFLIITLSDIELISLERVDNKLKNFDLIIIFKDYKRPVKTINNISKENLDDIKDWINSINIPFIEGGNLNLKWKIILDKIIDNPEDFIKEKCWEAFFESAEEESEASNYSEDSEFNDDEVDDDDEEEFENESDFTENDSEYEDDGEEDEYDDEESELEEEESADDKKKKKRKK